MVTQVNMVRPFMGGEIEQQSKTGFLDATALVRIGNKWRLNNNLSVFDVKAWIKRPDVREFKAELEKQYGTVYVPGGSKRGAHSWMHPFLFIDLALAINPQFKIEVYKWLYDQLLQYRNESGDSYKRMAGALYDSFPVKRDFPRFITKAALKIKNAIGVSDWQRASEDQLKNRDKIHDLISHISDLLPPEEAVRIAIKKVLEL